MHKSVYNIIFTHMFIKIFFSKKCYLSPKLQPQPINSKWNYFKINSKTVTGRKKFRKRAACKINNIWLFKFNELHNYGHGFNSRQLHQSWLDGVRTTPTKTGSYKSQQDTDQTVRRQKRIRNGVATPYDIKARWCGLFYWSWPALNRIHPITVQTYTVSLSSVSASRQMVTVIYPLPERE